MRHDEAPRTPARTSPTDAETKALAAIEHIEVEGVIDRYCSLHMLDRATGERTMRELLRFLALYATADEDRRYPAFDPPGGVDGIWHQFILSTRAYAACCERLGRFVHHNARDGRQPRWIAGHVEPLSGPRGYRPADVSELGDYEEFLDRYEALFGEPAPTDLWPRPVTADELARGCPGSTTSCMHPGVVNPRANS